MTTFVFAPGAPDQQADWADPSAWRGGVVPDGPDAAVSLPDTDPLAGQLPQVSIMAGESHEVASLTADQANVLLAGTLTVDDGLSLGGSAGLLLEGGTLSLGQAAVIGDTATLSGNGVVAGDVVDDGQVVLDPVGTGTADLFISGEVTGDGTVAIGTRDNPTSGNNVVELGGAASVGVTFGAGGGLLALDDPQDFTGTITPATLQINTGDSDVIGEAGEGNNVLLVGLSIADITDATYGGDADGGLLTLNETNGSLTLNIGGEHDPSDFDLAVGPTVDGKASVLVGIASGYAAPTVALSLADGTTSSYAIVNTGTLTVTGFVPTGFSGVSLLADGTIGEGSAAAPPIGNTYEATLATTLAPGEHRIDATAHSFEGTTTADPLFLLVLPDPVGGITAADVSSFQFAYALDGGATMNFVAGTEAVRLTDGTLSVGPDTAEASVQRLYEGLLGRAADPGGLAQFSALASTSGDAAVASAILGSREFTAAHGAPATIGDAQLVTLFYQGLLGRAPDAGGLASHVAALQAGTAPGNVAAGIADSGEAKAHDADLTFNLWVPDPTGAAVTALYETAFGRAPDEGGLAQFTAGLGSGLSLSQVASDLAGSSEFLADHAGQSNADLVRSLYANGLGRAPDAADLQGWAGKSAATVLLGVAASPEAAAYLIRTV